MQSDLLDGVDTLACCSPCPWACRCRRDLPSTGPGSSGMLIAGRAFRGCLFLASRLKGDLVRALICRPAAASPGTPGAAAADLSKRTIFVAALRCRPQHVGRVPLHGVGRRRRRRGSNFSRQVRRKSGILAGDPDGGGAHGPDYGAPAPGLWSPYGAGLRSGTAP